MVEVRVFLLYFRIQQVPLCPYHTSLQRKLNHHPLPICRYLQCWLIALSLTPLSIPHCNCGLLPLYFCPLLVPFPLFAQLLSLSLCLSVDCELISSFEKVMIPLCWDYVCVLHSVMAWLFIACRILIPQLKEWDDTCRELCASCSLTWKNGH